MFIEIYYFSGTGNSLFVAKQLAKQLKSELISVSSTENKEQIKSKADVIGIVFPVFYATNDKGVPLIINRFINKLVEIESKYIFAVSTSGYLAGETMENLSKLIGSRNAKLSAGFVVNMSNKYLVKDIKRKLKKVLFNKDGSYEKKAQKIYFDEKKTNEINNKLSQIVETVKLQKSAKLETRGILVKIIFTPLLYLLIKPIFTSRYKNLAKTTSNMPFHQLIQISDKSFKVNENCNACRICAKVCPVDNIKIVDNKPEWQHNCETCYACYQWCSRDAIYGKIVEHNEKYHHPEVNLSDMLRQNNNDKAK